MAAAAAQVSGGEGGAEIARSNSCTRASLVDRAGADRLPLDGFMDVLIASGGRALQVRSL